MGFAKLSRTGMGKRNHVCKSHISRDRPIDYQSIACKSASTSWAV